MRTFVLACLILTSATNITVAREVTIGMGNFAPYFIAERNSGIFTDIIEAIFRDIPDHQPKYLFGRPNKRLWHDFRKGKIDAVSNLLDSVKLEGCRSDPIFRFRDVAVTRVKDDLKIQNISDLAGKRIITFQGAKDFFGPEFARFTNFTVYTEVAQQELQSTMLYHGRADVSVGDMFIFLYSLRKIRRFEVKPSEFVFHEIFPPISSRMGFRDVELCALFNNALKQVRSSGEYENIYNAYLNNLGYKR